MIVQPPEEPTRTWSGSAWISVLEAAIIGPGVSGAEALSSTVSVAKMADALGLARVWVAEHHSTRDIGSTSPAVLLAHLAAVTDNIRLGAGGIMLRNHSPLAVAEQFATLSALHPGRIDLGIGRGTGGPPDAHEALVGGNDTEDVGSFLALIDDLRGFVNRDLPRHHRFSAVSVQPIAPPPPIYLLGASPESAVWAAERGLPYAYANHIRPSAVAPAIAQYRRHFRPDALGSEPHVLATMLLVCASDGENAERAAIGALALKLRLSKAHRPGSVHFATLNSPQLTEEEADTIRSVLSNGSMVVGSPQSVRAQLETFRERTEVDEVMVCCPEYRGEDRQRALNDLCQLT